MATKTVVTLVDDLTGEDGEGIETVEFALDGVTYEIDLDEDNAANLREAFADYVANGRRTDGRARARSNPAPRRNGSGSTGPRTREQSQAIRDWAATQGISVAVRGRIPGEVVAKYEAAQKR